MYADRNYAAGEHNALMADTASYITFLGGLVVDVARWNSIDHRPFLATDYVHVAIVYRYVVGLGARVVADPIVKLRLQPPTWLSRYFEVEMVNWPTTVWQLPREYYSDAAKQRVVDEHPTASVTRMAAMRGYGHYNRAEFTRHVAQDKMIPAWKKGLLWLIARLPRAGFRRAFLGYLRLRERQGPQGRELAIFRLEEATKWG